MSPANYLVKIHLNFEKLSESIQCLIAGMFGMKILDPIAIKEILEYGVDSPIIITDMKNPQKITFLLLSIGSILKVSQSLNGFLQGSLLGS